jgi:hypothetical protein
MITFNKNYFGFAILTFIIEVLIALYILGVEKYWLKKEIKNY